MEDFSGSVGEDIFNDKLINKKRDYIIIGKEKGMM